MYPDTDIVQRVEQLRKQIEHHNQCYYEHDAPQIPDAEYDRLFAELLALEEKLARPGSDVALDDQLYQEPQAAPVAVPMGKFAMYPDWQPDADFIRLAALWGVALREPVTTEELASFIAYWQAEGKVFHHVQWQQKLARSLQIGRASNGGLPKRDVNTVSEPDSQIPPGFRG